MARNGEAVSRGIEGKAFDTIARAEDLLMNIFCEF
jgi:hypothetical protein